MSYNFPQSGSHDPVNLTFEFNQSLVASFNDMFDEETMPYVLDTLVPEDQRGEDFQGFNHNPLNYFNGIDPLDVEHNARVAQEAEDEANRGETRRTLVHHRLTENLYLNTSLEEPEWVDSGPAEGRCRWEHRERYFQMQREDFADFFLWQFEMLAEERRSARKEARTRHWNELKADKAYKQHSECKKERQEAANQLISELQTWGKESPEIHAQFMKHLKNAGAASKATVRVVQIAGWFRSGMPEPVTQALKELTMLLHREVALKAQLAECEDVLGNEPEFLFKSERAMRMDDEAWVLASKYPYGYEPRNIHNGISHYRPQGDGASLVEHMMAHFEIRKVRLAHAASCSESMEPLFRAMMSFRDCCFCILRQTLEPKRRSKYNMADRVAFTKAYVALKQHRFTAAEKAPLEIGGRSVISGASEKLPQYFDFTSHVGRRSTAHVPAPVKTSELPEKGESDSEDGSDGGVELPQHQNEEENDSGVELASQQSDNESDGGVQLPESPK